MCPVTYAAHDVKKGGKINIYPSFIYLFNTRVTVTCGYHSAKKVKQCYITVNTTNVETAVRILGLGSDITTRKTFWIHSKNPKIGRKEESFAITIELSSFLGFCGLL